MHRARKSRAGSPNVPSPSERMIKSESIAHNGWEPWTPITSCLAKRAGTNLRIAILGGGITDLSDKCAARQTCY